MVLDLFYGGLHCDAVVYECEDRFGESVDYRQQGPCQGGWARVATLKFVIGGCSTFAATVDDIDGLGGAHEIPLSHIFSNLLDDSAGRFLGDIFIVATGS